MHVYTMGTRAYASEVCKIIDPDGGLFGGRILSRDESGSTFFFRQALSLFFWKKQGDVRSFLTILGGSLGMTRKSLQRLFPCDTSMVVIIDDRADVWDGSPNLVKVVPCTFLIFPFFLFCLGRQITHILLPAPPKKMNSL